VSVLQSEGKQNHTYELCWQKYILFKVFSFEGIGIEYSPELVTNTNDDSSSRGYDPTNFYHSMRK